MELSAVLVILIFVATVAGGYALDRYLRKKLQEAWRAEAQRRGFQVLVHGDAVQGRFGHFKVFGKGRGRRVIAAISGEAQGAEITLVDYRYVTGSGKHRRVHRRTICVLSAPELRLPHFYVRPEIAVFDLLGKVFGGQDINFDEDPEFSKAFVLQGMDAQATRQLFDQRVRRHFLRYRGRRLEIEGVQQSLLLHDGRKRKPQETQELVDLALGFFNLLR